MRQDGLVQRSQVDIVHVEGRTDLSDDALHAATAPVVHEGVRIEVMAPPGLHLAHLVDQASMPVQHRATRVEGDRAVVHLQTSAAYSPRAG